MSSRLFLTIATLLALDYHVAAAQPAFARSALLGVWVVVACESFSPHRAGSPATVPNCKFCFGTKEAYPDLPADEVNDSADGSGDYYVVGGDILVIRTGVPGGLFAFQLVTVGAEQIVWHRGEWRVTLRRIARTWDGIHTPKLRPRNLPVSYLP